MTDWVLTTGYWDDSKVWDDAAVYTDRSVSGVLTVITKNITQLSVDTVRLKGSITDEGGYKVTGHGFAWSLTNPLPTKFDDYSDFGSGSGDFTQDLSVNDITAGTYYVRAWAVQREGIVWGVTKTFTIAESVDSYKYIGQFYDIEQKLHKVEIYRPNFPLDSTYNILYFDANSLDLHHSGSDKNGMEDTIIQGQELICNLHIPRDDVDKFDALFESRYKDYVVSYTVYINPTAYPNGAKHFLGFLKPENMVKRYEKSPPSIEIQLSANDGIADLKGIEFKDAGGGLIKGKYTILDLLQKALRPIIIHTNGSIYGNDNGFKIQLGTYETTGMSSTDCALKKIYVTADHFYKVIEKDSIVPPRPWLVGLPHPLYPFGIPAEIKVYEFEVMSCYDVIAFLLKDFNVTFKLSYENPTWGKLYWYIQNPHELNSYEFEYNWDLVFQDRLPTNNIIDITEYKFIPNIEQQKIHPLTMAEAVFKNKDTGSDLSLGDLTDWYNTWFVNFTSFSTIHLASENIFNVLRAISVTAQNPENTLTLASAFPIVKGEEKEYIRVYFDCRMVSMTWSRYKPYLHLVMQLQRPNGTLSVPYGYGLDTGKGVIYSVQNGKWRSFDSGVQEIFEIKETGNYNVIITIKHAEPDNWRYDWDELILDFANVKIRKVKENNISDFKPVTSSENREFRQSQTKGYDTYSTEVLLADGLQITETGSFLYNDTGTYRLTNSWNSYGGLQGVPILDIFFQFILKNRSGYKNYLRATIVDREHTIGLKNLLVIDSKSYFIASYSRNYRDGMVSLELIEIISTLVGGAIEYEPIQELTLKSATVYQGTEEPPSVLYGETQEAHGFTVGDVIRYDSVNEIYVKAQANYAATAKAVGIVSDVISDDLFKYISDGYIYKDVDLYSSLGLIEGEYYFLSPYVAGKMITVDLLNAGDIEQCIGFVTSKGFKIEIDARMIELPGLLSEMSVIGTGRSTNKFKLKNDEETPAVLSYYGTNAIGTKGFHLIPEEYVWNLHSSEEIIGYLTEPVNLAVNVDGTGSVIESVAAGDVVVTAINTNGETLPINVPAFDVLDDSTQAIISWDVVEGATGYRVYDAATGNYTETILLNIDYITFSPVTAGSVPIENTAAIFQLPFEIENGDTVDIVGKGIDVETKVDVGDSTRKEVKLIKQQSDWDEADIESPNFIKGKPEVLDGDSAYIYIAYASDDSGTDFTTTFNPVLDYIAILSTDTEIVSPVVGDFAGLWKKYKGEDGQDGQDASSDVQDLTGRLKYGALYNWWAATDARKITSSDDWNIPSDVDFNTLVTYIGGASVAGGKLKETGLVYWNEPNEGATNEVQFNGRGSGARSWYTGDFSELKNLGLIWLSNEKDANNAWRAGYGYYGNETTSVFNSQNKNFALAIRLVRDATIEEQSLPDGTYCDNYIGNDWKSYKSVKIGTQVWLASNLCETHFRDGTPILGPTFTNTEWYDLTATESSAYCFYDDNPDNGWEPGTLTETIETIFENLDGKEHNSLEGLQGGNETERYHLTAAELADVQALGSISPYDFWVGTQAQYDAIGTKDANTIYHIEEE